MNTTTKPPTIPHIEPVWEIAQLFPAQGQWEVVNPNARDRDAVIKRREYAEAGIPAYWIVDPETRRITVLRLQERLYVEHGDWDKGEQATSAPLPGFVVEVAHVFGASD